jgi:cytochrome c biogenesis factor
MMRMDAADQSVEIGLRYVRPLIPVDVFYKPLTSLVWLGTGILTFGGLLSTWYRRFKKKDATESLAEVEEESNDDALVPVA